MHHREFVREHFTFNKGEMPSCLASYTTPYKYSYLNMLLYALLLLRPVVNQKKIKIKIAEGSTEQFLFSFAMT